MSDEYTNDKLEAKASDSSSGSYSPPAETIPAKESPEQELYHICVYMAVLLCWVQVRYRLHGLER